jgi:hypothetical protein
MKNITNGIRIVRTRSSVKVAVALITAIATRILLRQQRNIRKIIPSKVHIPIANHFNPSTLPVLLCNKNRKISVQTKHPPHHLIIYMKNTDKISAMNKTANSIGQLSCISLRPLSIYPIVILTEPVNEESDGWHISITRVVL